MKRAALLAVLLTACSQQLPTTNETAADPAVPPRSAADQARAPATPADPLSAKALEAQQSLLASRQAATDHGTRQRDVRELINNKVLAAFHDAASSLKGAGVKFDKAEYGLNTLNVHRRGQGVFELDTIYQDADDTFRIVGDHLTSDPFALVWLTGTASPQTFGAEIPQDVVDDAGALRPECKAEVPNNPNMNMSDSYPCRDIVSGKADERLRIAAKKYLTAALKLAQ